MFTIQTLSTGLTGLIMYFIAVIGDILPCIMFTGRGDIQMPIIMATTMVITMAIIIAIIEIITTIQATTLVPVLRLPGQSLQTSRGLLLVQQ